MVFNSVIKYALISFANAHTEATSVMAASTAVPVFTAIFAYIDPNEHENPLELKYLAFIPILVGVFLLTPQRAQVTSPAEDDLQTPMVSEEQAVSEH